MSRWLDREEEKQESSSSFLEGLSRSGGEARPRVTTDLQVQKGFGENRRERIVLKDREYRVRASEFEALTVLGRFRVADASDMVRGVYNKDVQLAIADFRSLYEQKLIAWFSFKSAKGNDIRVYTLTPEGRALLTGRSSGEQRFYAGIVKPAECEHDILLYRAYLREEDRLKDEGSVIKRVVLDYELKGKHFSWVNKPGDGQTYRERQVESAHELHLPVIDGHVVFPDFRIECENERGEPSRADIEVATGNYRGKHIAAKTAAGFRVYAERGGLGGPGVDRGPHLRGNVFRQDRGIVFPL